MLAMKFLEQRGNFLQINISQWTKFNGPNSFTLYYINEPLTDSTIFNSYTIPIADIVSSFTTKESGHYKFYIVGKDGYMSCFEGTVDSIADLHANFVNVCSMNKKKSVSFQIPRNYNK
jgi:hypothetical protein